MLDLHKNSVTIIIIIIMALFAFLFTFIIWKKQFEQELVLSFESF